MILILEDDNDRQAYQRGSPFRQDFYTEDEDKNPVTVWISPEAYRQETVLDGLRAKVLAVDPVEWALAGQDAGRMMIDLINSANE